MRSAGRRRQPAPWLSSGALCPVQNQFDSIDLTDNAIVRLEGFPKMHRLKQLLLSNNRISRIARGLEGWSGTARSCVQPRGKPAISDLLFGRAHECAAESIPNLDTLILTNNRISNLQVGDAPAAAALDGREATAWMTDPCVPGS